MSTDSDKRDLRADDLFESSKMPFTAHLEELRSSLVKSLMGLAVGFLISLIFANKIVQFVQTPLEKGLKQFYTERDSMRMREVYNLSPRQVEKLRDFMIEHEVTVELMMLERNELPRLQASDPSDPLAELTGGGGDEGPVEEDDELIDAVDVDDSAAVRGAAELGIVHGPWEEDPRLVQVRVWKPQTARIIALSVPEAFLIWVKAAVIGGFIIACPWIFYQMWLFVAAGLYPHERKYVYIYIPFSVVLFLSGVSMAFFVVFGYVLDFLFTFNAAMGLEAEPRISEWLSFVLVLPIGFGIAFQLPLAMLLLHRIGMFSIEAYIAKWRLAVLVIFVLSMFLTPADPISMMAMAGPLTALYFLGIILCRFMPRSRNPYAEAYDPGEA